MATKTKKFDAVEMSRLLREKTGRLLSRMNRAKKIKFLNRHLKNFRIENQRPSLVGR